MADRPILFNGPMICGLLDGRKTMTRRILKPQPEQNMYSWDWRWTPPGYPKRHLERVWWREGHGPGSAIQFYLPYAVGDRLFPAMEIASLNRNYCADLYGRIWSRAKDGKTWDVLKGGPTGRGYLSITPAHEGKYRTRLIHRLVAEAFYGPQPKRLPQVRHLDGNLLNNAPKNLDWGTQEDNWTDRLVLKRSLGESHHNAKLSKKDVKAILASDKSQRELARKHGVTQSTIWAVKQHLTWQKHPKPNPANTPRWASRLTLLVTDVRVQRLQDISEEDAIAEGIERINYTGWGDEPGVPSPPEPDVYPLVNKLPDFTENPMEAYRHLWDSINAKRNEGKYAWEANPWIVALTFKVVRSNIDAVGVAA